MRKVLLIAFLVCALSVVADAQFNSGSTGADGALDLSVMTCPNNICEVQLPESGVLNYTTVNIPQGKTLIFKFNSRNTPVILLAQGAVNIAGSLIISATFPAIPGAGGFYGGTVSGGRGQGPGGGQSGVNDGHGKWVGSLSLVPIIGGSGGSFSGGGGAIVIASSTSISVTGTIAASGGPSSGNTTNGPGSGSGGAIRLVSNMMTISGNLRADGGGNNDGMIRLEAPQGQINFTGTADPTPVFAQINPVIIPTNPPTLRIASIGGYAVPSYSAGRPDRVDLMLPTQLTDPINIEIQGSNVPSGTQVQIQLSGSSGTATGCTLTGGPGPVACNASVSGLNRNGVSTLLAVAVFNPPSLAQAFNPKGANQVAKVRLESTIGGKARYIFLSSNGSEIDAKKLSPQFLQQFGL